MEDLQTNEVKTENGAFKLFLNEKNAFAEKISERILEYFKEDKKPEVELIEVYLTGFKNAINNSGVELQRYFDQSDFETKSLIENHINNTGITMLLSNSNNLMKRNSGVLGFLEKIAPIIEIIKKLINHIIELFPRFLERILKKIILPILELIDNLIKQVLELFGNKSASSYLKIAERDFLETHPLWRKLQFNTLDTSSII